MTRLALVNMNCYRTALGRTQLKIEPVHLLPMHNIARGRGLESRIFQFDPDAPRSSRRQIAAFAPQVLGLSFIGSSVETLDNAEKLLRSLTPRPILLVGGTDIKPHADHYFERVRRYYPYDQQKNAYALIVPGPGERLMEALTEAEFELFRALDLLREHQKWKTLPNGMRVGGGMIVNGNTYYLEDTPAIPLAEQAFQRDYDLSAFGNRATVKWSAGCWGRCCYCVNEPGGIDYRPTEQVRREMGELMAGEVKGVKIASANFTADPLRSSEIVATLPKIEEGYVFGSRVDSLYRAITAQPEAWRHFAQVGDRIDLGVESLVPQRLVRLGKYQKISQAIRQAERLEAILTFFAGTPLKFSVFLMPFDWQMTMAEAEQEAALLQELWDRHPWGIRIDSSAFSNITHHVSGSLWSKTMKEEDFYRFDDPRLLLAALVLRTKSAEVDLYGRGRSIDELALSRLMLKYQQTVIGLVGAIPAGELKGDRAAQIFARTRDERKTLKDLFSQLGLLTAWRLRRELAREFRRIFSGLDKELDFLAGAMIGERITDQEIAGKIKEIFLQALKS